MVPPNKLHPTPTRTDAPIVRNLLRSAGGPGKPLYLFSAMLLIRSSLRERKRFTAVPLNYYLPDHPTGELLCARSCRLRGGTVPESCVSVDKGRAVIGGGDKATGIASRSLIV